MSALFSTADVSSSRFAGRLPVGSAHPVTVQKRGQYHMRQVDGDVQETLACGLACSEIFSGRRLAAVLRPGFEYERAVLEGLEADLLTAPLSIHTSAGVPAALETFIAELSHHLPWRFLPGDDDWCVSLQMEGASAVMAAVDLAVQLRQCTRTPGAPARDISAWKVAVGTTSYHGPPSTSPGASTPLFKDKHNQVAYPTPTPYMSAAEQTAYIACFSAWLAVHGDSVACMLIEPQWGSTAAAFPWPVQTLRHVIALAHERGVLVIADEIMCGLGRHAQGSVFLSEAWRLDVDAVTFGKAVAAGAFPLSGAILRHGAIKLGTQGRTVLQSHTYSGGHVRALLTATEVLRVLPSHFIRIKGKAEQLKQIMERFQSNSEDLFIVHGIGLMWGALVNQKHPAIKNADSTKDLMLIFKEQCTAFRVLPYFVPVGGFMVTPLFDIDDPTMEDIGTRLNQALLSTISILGCVKS